MFARTRGYIPHREDLDSTYFVTFRLNDSLPAESVAKWKMELQQSFHLQKSDPASYKRKVREYYRRVESHLDQSFGECFLKRPEIASIVSGALRYFDQQRYILHAWTIMPNHVHALFSALESRRLSSIMHSWKGFTAHEANKILGRSGTFWEHEYFDRMIRSQRHFAFSARYVLNNPLKAGLCKEFYQYGWSGFSEEVGEMMRRSYMV